MRGRDEMSIYRQRGWEPFLMTPHAARQLNKPLNITFPPSMTHYLFIFVSFFVLQDTLALDLNS